MMKNKPVILDDYLTYLFVKHQNEMVAGGKGYDIDINREREEKSNAN